LLLTVTEAAPELSEAASVTARCCQNSRRVGRVNDPWFRTYEILPPMRPRSTIL